MQYIIKDLQIRIAYLEYLENLALNETPLEYPEFKKLNYGI